MSTMTGCPHLEGYDPLSPEQLSDPFTTWERARRNHPVFFAQDLGVWTATSYEDVTRILEDSETFVNGGTLGGNNVPDKYRERFPDGVWSNAALINRDGDDHRQAKRLAQKAFLPRRINEMEPHVRSFADELLDPLVARGEGDLMTEYAAPFTIRTITRVLGLSPEDSAMVHQVTEDALVILTPGNAEVADGDDAWTPEQLERFDRVVAFKDRLAEVITARRDQPDDGVISALVHAEVDGRHLTDDEVEGMVLEQLIAGNDTTSNLIAHAVHYLSARPDLWEEVATDLSLLPRVIDEVVRRHTPSKGLFRRTTTDVSFGDVVVPAGQLVHVLWGSANTDEAHFTDPLDIRLDRENIDTHVGFGRGTHKCLGSLLARLEAEVALEGVFTRLGRVTVTEPLPLRYAPALTNVSLLGLQARWAGGRR